ncbi:hypothetical protein B7P43_G04871 [Cryptotermes secundus]|uniref:Uncharacterized protein n=1 Tax=Cryptotermes secundus TaxID=105785 RepID=A0A2J7PW65_9NEOP|nr:hypothetical protein B7P43_G04871 [Cryptotermes secundus]
MEAFFLILLSTLYTGSLQLHTKYLLPQYTICCNPVLSFLFILLKGLTKRIIKHFKLAARV